MKALSVKALKKVYPNGVAALKGIDLDVEQGDFFALLGQNGAGKSTTIGIICSLINKSSGKFLYLIMIPIRHLPKQNPALVLCHRKLISIPSKRFPKF